MLFDTHCSFLPLFFFFLLQPNSIRSSSVSDWDNRRVLHQVKYLGLKENVKIRKEGYAAKWPFDEFERKYRAVLNGKRRNSQGANRAANGNEDLRHRIESTLRALYPSSIIALGRSKLFIKDAETIFLLEEELDRRVNAEAAKIQRAWHRYKQKVSQSDRGVENTVIHFAT